MPITTMPCVTRPDHNEPDHHPHVTLQNSTAQYSPYFTLLDPTLPASVVPDPALRNLVHKPCLHILYVSWLLDAAVEAVRAQSNATPLRRLRDGVVAGSSEGVRWQRANWRRPQCSRRRPWEWLRDRARFRENLVIVRRHRISIRYVLEIDQLVLGKHCNRWRQRFSFRYVVLKKGSSI